MLLTGTYRLLGPTNAPSSTTFTTGNSRCYLGTWYKPIMHTFCVFPATPTTAAGTLKSISFSICLWLSCACGFFNLFLNLLTLTPSTIPHRTKFQKLTTLCICFKSPTSFIQCPWTLNTAKFGELSLHIHHIYCFPSSVNSHAPFSAISFPDWNIPAFCVQFPNFLVGLFCIFCNSVTYSPQDGETKPACSAPQVSAPRLPGPCTAPSILLSPPWRW